MNIDRPHVSMSGLPQQPCVVELVVDGASDSLALEYEWAMICKEIFEVFKTKQKDYGPHNIGLAGDSGIVTRMMDKFMRLHTLYQSGADPQNESVDDTWIDIADYAIIAMMYRRGHWPKSNLKEVLSEQLK